MKNVIMNIPRFRKMPQVEHRVLTARISDYCGGTGLTWKRYGLLEPLGVLPNYLTEMMTMYDRARIYASSIKLQFINTSTEPIKIVTAVLPHSFVSGSPTIEEIADSTTAKQYMVSKAGGMDRVEITHKMSSAKVLGSSAFLSDYDFTYAQAALTTPLVADEPVWTVLVCHPDGSTAKTGYLEVIVDWSIEFYDLDAL